MSAYLICEIEELDNGFETRRQVDGVVKHYLPQARHTGELCDDVRDGIFYGCWVIPWIPGTSRRVGKLARRLKKLHRPVTVNVTGMIHGVKPSLLQSIVHGLQSWWSDW